MKISYALLDSGVGQDARVTSAAAFVSGSNGVEKRQTAYDRLGHGAALQAIIARHAPDALLHNAQIFSDRLSAPADVVGAALDWAVEAGVQLINMSFGMRQDRDILRQACSVACEAGIILVASSPARGEAVYPALYPGVLRVTGDARCEPDLISVLDTEQAEFGACPRDFAVARDTQKIGGSSFAAAHVSGILLRWLAAGSHAENARDYLRSMASWRGPENRSR